MKMDPTSHLCRLCAQPSHELIGVFSEAGRMRRITDKVHIHLPIQITAEDCLPTSVCEQCLDSLEVCHNLLKLCLDADSRLRKILEIPEDPSHLATLNELKMNIGLHCETSLPIVKDDAGQSDVLPTTESKISESCTSEVSNGAKTGELFNCEMCSKELPNAEELLQHGAQHHSSEEKHLCSICGELSYNYLSYVNHLCTHFEDGDNTIWECGNCGGNISSVEALKLHMCEDCDIRPEGEHSSSLRGGINNESQMFSCSKCSLELKCKKDLKTHLKSHAITAGHIRKPSTRGKRGVECRVCGKIFESFWYMTRHRSEDHSKEEVALALRRHGLDREKFECHVCGKLLSCQFTYKHHLQAHEGVRNHQCPDCGRSFVYLAQLKSHMLVHTDGPHACSMCSKQFPNAFALRVHVRTHTGERPFQCEQCPKAFHSRANYEQHVVIHTNKRKYICHLCPYRARRPEALRTHLRVHTNERPYACKVCGRGFKQKYDCTKHERLHAKRSLGAPLDTKGSRSASLKFRRSVSVEEMLVDEPNQRPDLLENNPPFQAGFQASDPATVGVSAVADDKTSKQEIFVAYEEASDQCSVYWNTS